jgi:hypothetical protein
MASGTVLSFLVAERFRGSAGFDDGAEAALDGIGDVAQ